MGGCTSRENINYVDFDFSDEEFEGIISIYQELISFKIE